jgi:hypothetical protein
VDDQSTLPSSYHSFVASGRYDEPDAPASKYVKLFTNGGTSFTSIEMFHTHTRENPVFPGQANVLAFVAFSLVQTKILR